MLDLNSAMEFKFNASLINALTCTCSHLVNSLGRPPSFARYMSRPPPMPPFPFALLDPSSHNKLKFRHSDDLQTYLDKLFYQNTTTTTTATASTNLENSSPNESTPVSSLNIITTSLVNSNSYILVIIVTISVLIVLLLLFIFASFVYVYATKLKMYRKQQSMFKSSFNNLATGHTPTSSSSSTESSLTFSTSSASTSPTSCNHLHQIRQNAYPSHKLNSFKQQSVASSSSSSSCSNNELLLLNLNSSSLSSISSPHTNNLIKPCHHHQTEANSKNTMSKLNLLQQQQQQSYAKCMQQHHYESINDEFDQLYFDIAENNAHCNAKYNANDNAKSIANTNANYNADSNVNPNHNQHHSQQILSASTLNNLRGPGGHFPVTCCSCTILNRINHPNGLNAAASHALKTHHSANCNASMLSRPTPLDHTQNQSTYYLKSLLV